MVFYNCRYRFNTGKLLGHIRTLPNMNWADGNAIKNQVELQIRLILGPKTVEDLNAENTKGKAQVKAAGNKSGNVPASKPVQNKNNSVANGGGKANRNFCDVEVLPIYI